MFAGLSEVTHPVHLSEEGASALIPFCAYQSDLAIVDPVKKIRGISYPVCSSFHQTMLEGQLCFDLKLNKMSGQGKYNELMLILDYNEDRSIQPKHQTEEYLMNSTKLRLDTLKSLEDSEAKVQINTLSTFTGFGGGSYKMTDVKRMTTTSDFLHMPMDKRHCKVEQYEHCKTRNLLRECTSLVGGNNCSFTFQDCIQKNAEKTFNCSVSCKGIYADVEWTDERVLQEKSELQKGEEVDRTKLMQIIEEYQDNKERYLRNFQFNAYSNSSTFGKKILVLSFKHINV